MKLVLDPLTYFEENLAPEHRIPRAALPWHGRPRLGGKHGSGVAPTATAVIDLGATWH